MEKPGAPRDPFILESFCLCFCFYKVFKTNEQKKNPNKKPFNILLIILSQSSPSKTLESHSPITSSKGKEKKKLNVPENLGSFYSFREFPVCAEKGFCCCHPDPSQGRGRWWYQSLLLSVQPQLALAKHLQTLPLLITSTPYTVHTEIHCLRT